ncbi:MAG: hypothetical protein QM684_19615 [Rhizobium sp.]
MAEEHEQLIDAALALDGTIHQKTSTPSPAGNVPEDATDVPTERNYGAERFAAKRKQG